MKKIQYRIIFFLSLVSLAFALRIMQLEYSEKRNTESALGSLRTEKQIMLEKLFSLQNRNLETYVYDYSCWDEMLNFVNNPDDKWSFINLQSTMPTFKLNYLWVYKSDFSLVYSHIIPSEYSRMDFPLSKEELKNALNDKWFRHFFIKTAHGIAEINIAPIQTESDLKRTSAPGGYIVAGKILTGKYLDEMSQLLSSKFTLLPYSGKTYKEVSSNQSDSLHIIRNTLLLRDYKNKPLAILYCKSESGLMKLHSEQSSNMIIWSSAFAVVIFLLNLIFLIRVIGRPLGLISRSLQTENSGVIIPLLRQKTEFGVISRMITDFFAQREILKKAKFEAENADKAKSIFLGNLSHEIRTSMSTILGFSELLRHRVFDAEAQKFLTGVITSGKNLIGVIDNILNYSNIETGKVNISMKPFKFSEMISEIRDIFLPMLNKKNVNFDIKTGDSLPPEIVFDEIHLRQVLYIIISNAVKFTENGYVHLSFDNISGTENGKFTMLISISDTGIGIPAEKQERIFVAYNQLDVWNAGEFSGAGLGLATAKRLVELMNGSIKLHSEPGKGSRFDICFQNIEIPDSDNWK